MIGVFAKNEFTIPEFVLFILSTIYGLISSDLFNFSTSINICSFSFKSIFLGDSIIFAFAVIHSPERSY